MTATHPLDTVPASLVLDKCFQFMGCFSRWTGIIPISIDDVGYSHFSFRSRPFFHTVVYVGLVISLSYVYMPMYLRQTNVMKEDSLVNYISENLFMGGQICGVTLTIVLIPFIASRFTRVWNKLVPITEFIVEHGYKDEFRGPYRRSRVSLIFYIILLNVYGLVCWRTFATGSELQNLKGTVMFWVHAGGYIFLFMLGACHFIPGFVMLFLLFTTKHCISALSLEVRKGGNGVVVGIGIGTSRQDIEGQISLYQAITAVVEEIGRTFGLYLVLQLVVMMTSVLMNVFTMLSSFEQRDPLSTILSFLGYSLWIILLTEGGERFRLVVSTFHGTMERLEVKEVECITIMLMREGLID
jgi:hypothetical protein